MNEYSQTAWIISLALLFIPVGIFLIKYNVFGNFQAKRLLLSVNLALTIQIILGVFAWLVMFLPEKLDKPIKIELINESAELYFTIGLYVYLPFIVLINIVLFKRTVRKYKDRSNQVN